MDTVRVRCVNPACGRVQTVPAGGVSLACSHCGAFLLVEADIPVPPPARAETFASIRVDETARLPRVTEQSLTRSGNHPRGLTRLGRFEVRGRVGGGGFGVVYRAFDPQLEREVALKVPRPGTLDDDDSVERFLREAKAAAQLRHPHIVPIYDAGCEGDLHYIASAFIQGRTLSSVVDEGPLAPERTARIVRDLAEALDYAHEQGVVHRDVKPSNVLLDEQDRPHLMDFGIARVDTGAEKLTRDGAVMGTPAYMSPEQAHGHNDQVGPASDQYSLGALFYELLTGQAPFSGPPHMVLLQVVSDAPKPPRSINPDVPRDLETICLKALSKEIGGRYASCADLIDDLNRWLRNEPVSARPAGLVERTTRWARRNPAIAGLTAATFVLLLAVATVSTVAAIRMRALAERERDQTERANLAAAEARTATERANNEARLARAETERANSAAEQAREERTRAETLAKQNADLAAQERRARQDVELAVKRAEEESGKAILARTEATSARQIALDEAQRSAVSKYIEQINAAEREWKAGDANGVAERLRATQPASLAGIDLRGPEWHLLDRFARGYDRLLTLPGATPQPVLPLACSESRNELLCGPFPSESGQGANVVAFRIPDGQPVWTATFPGPVATAAYSTNAPACRFVAENTLFAVTLPDPSASTAVSPTTPPLPLESTVVAGNLDSLLAPTTSSLSLALFSPNGEWLCVANAAAYRVVAARSPAGVVTPVPRTDTRASRFAFSEDSNRLAYFQDKELVVQDMVSGEALVRRPVSIKQKKVVPWRIVAYSARDELAVALPGPTGISTKTGLSRWTMDSEGFEELPEAPGHDYDSRVLAVASRSGRMKCLDIKSGQPQGLLSVDTTGHSLVLPGGRQVAVSTIGGVALHSLSLTGGQPHSKRFAWLQAGAISDDVKDWLRDRLAPGYRDSIITGFPSSRLSLALSPRPGFLQYPPQAFGFIDPQAGDEVPAVRYPLKFAPTAVARSGDGRGVVFGDSKGGVWRFDLIARSAPVEVGRLSRVVVAVDTNVTGAVAAIDLEGTAKVWSAENVETASMAGTFNGNTGDELVIRLSTDGTQAAFADRKLANGVRLVAPGQPVSILLDATAFRMADGTEPALVDLAVADKGSRVAVLDDGRRVTLWSRTGGEPVSHFVDGQFGTSRARRGKGLDEEPRAVEFDATGERLVVVRDGRFDFVHAATGRRLISFAASGGPRQKPADVGTRSGSSLLFGPANAWCEFHFQLESRRFDIRPLEASTRGEREADFAAAYHSRKGANAESSLRADRTLADEIRDRALSRLDAARSTK